MYIRLYSLIRLGYGLLVRWSGPVVFSVLLLLFRVVFGYQFYLAGTGKLQNIQRPIAFFTDLHIPFPTANAWFVAFVETIGGLLLLFGFASRPVALALAINMTVAYLTADHEAVVKFLSDGEPMAMINAAPFWFWMTSLAVLALGPGIFSVDAAVKWWLCRWKKCNAMSASAK